MSNREPQETSYSSDICVNEIVLPGRVLSRHTGGNTTYARNLAAGLVGRGIKVSTMPAHRSSALTALQETYEGLRRRSPGKVIHYTADTGTGFRARVPTVVTVHGVASRWIKTARTPSQEWLWRRRVAMAIAASDQIITVSHSSARDISAVFGLSIEKITVIHHGIDAEYFATPQKLSPQFAHLARVPYLLYLGNIEPRKNLVELVRACSSSGIRSLGVKLVIAGRPAWNYKESMAAIEDSDVEYLGQVSDSDRVALLQHATLFVFPSQYEGFGFPVLEAMAAGTPVLSSDRGSLAEVMGPATPLSDISRHGIAEGITRSLQNQALLSETVDRGKIWVSKFSWDRSLKEHLGIYQKALAR